MPVLDERSSTRTRDTTTTTADRRSTSQQQTSPKRKSSSKSRRTSPQRSQQTTVPDDEEGRLVDEILVARTYYQVLGLCRECNADDIRKGYLKRSRAVHPDKCAHPRSNDAFHALSTAYETLRDPRQRRMYDVSDCDSERFAEASSGSPFAPFFTASPMEQTWRACLTELFTEFLNANYQPVLSIVDLLNTQNPDLSVSRESIQDTLVALRELVVAGKLRVDLCQPEIAELRALAIDGPKLSFFDVVGRSRNSLRATRLALSMFYKSVHGQEPQGAMVQRQPSSDDARDASSNADLIERVLAVVSRMEREVGRVDDWIGGWTGWLRGG